MWEYIKVMSTLPPELPSVTLKVMSTLPPELPSVTLKVMSTLPPELPNPEVQHLGEELWGDRIQEMTIYSTTFYPGNYSLHGILNRSCI